MIKGYYNNDAANRESYDSDGFYHTGDIGLCDGKTKKWYIVDRKKVNPVGPLHGVDWH
jgi:long-subunit acyl-CoA synthetase (AMP-forming)